MCALFVMLSAELKKKKVNSRIATAENLRWRVVADQIDSFGPDHSPYVHVVTHIDGTADPITGCPHQLKNKQINTR